MIVFLISSFFIGGPGIRNYPVIFRPHPVSINLDPELVERLQDVKRNFHRRFWDKRNSVLKFCSTNQTEHLGKAIRSDSVKLLNLFLARVQIRTRDGGVGITNAASMLYHPPTIVEYIVVSPVKVSTQRGFCKLYEVAAPQSVTA